MKRSVVCISHATGAGGREIGRLVAENLDFDYVDEEIVAWAAGKAGVEPKDVADEERRKPLLARVLDEIGRAGGEAWTGVVIPPTGAGRPAGDELRELIRDAIEATAARGKVVIVAHAASHAIGRRADALRVLVTASPSARAERLAAREGLDDARAARAVKEADAGRADYLRRFYDVREELPTQYDIVLNTDVLSIEDAAALVAQTASR